MDTDDWSLYEHKRAPDIAWPAAAEAVRRGEPLDDIFTLPWWSTEQQTTSLLWGTQHNRDRIGRLTGARPAGTTVHERPWHVGILYPGVPDQYMQRAVGVVTRAGHVGCLPPDAALGGIDALVRSTDHAFKHVCVPVFIDDDGVRVPLPFGRDVSAFDDPWPPSGDKFDRVRKPWRINRSHLMAILLAKHGPTDEWLSITNNLVSLTEDQGVTVLEPLSLTPGTRVVNDVRGDAGAAFVDRICDVMGLIVEGSFTPRSRVVITRYLHSMSSGCRAARAAGAPIYRADGFGGSIAEALRHQLVADRDHGAA
jgi:hypothetical protein